MMAHRRPTDRAFTLIELLVVVAIIALLISILLPSLSRARDQTKMVTCKSNLRSIGQAFSMYAQEFKGVWPSAVDSMGQQNRWPVPFFRAKIVHEELNQYDATGNLLKAGSSKTMFLCPSEQAPRSIANWRVAGNTVDRVEVGGSFAYTGEVHRDANDLRLGDPNTPPFVNPVDNCRRPSEIIMMMDNFKPLKVVGDPGWRYYRDNFFAGYRTLAGGPVIPASTGDRFKIIGERHLGATNQLFIDSHVVNDKPNNVTYNQVSWARWANTAAAPPGGK